MTIQRAVETGAGFGELRSIAVQNKKPPACAGGSSFHSSGNWPIEQRQ
jgi:hypothetical protein